MSIIASAAALVVGFVLGLLGGGGSILAVPMLVYLVGVDPKEAIATSLFVVGATAAMAAFQHARAGNVAWRTGILFGAFAMVGAFGGGMLAEYIPGAVLLTAFGGLMLVTAVAMLRSSGPPEAADADKPLPIVKIALEGIVVGGITGLVGAGGGFLVVPALVLLGGLPMRRAIGTSLVVITMNSAAGFAGYASHVAVDYPMAIGFTALALIGSVIGAWTTAKVDAARLRSAFAVFVLLMGGAVLWREFPATADLKLAFVLGAVVSGLAAVAVLAGRNRSVLAES